MRSYLRYASVLLVLSVLMIAAGFLLPTAPPAQPPVKNLIQWLDGRWTLDLDATIALDPKRYGPDNANIKATDNIMRYKNIGISVNAQRKLIQYAGYKTGYPASTFKTHNDNGENASLSTSRYSLHLERQGERVAISGSDGNILVLRRMAENENRSPFMDSLAGVWESTDEKWPVLLLIRPEFRRLEFVFRKDFAPRTRKEALRRYPDAPYAVLSENADKASLDITRPGATHSFERTGNELTITDADGKPERYRRLEIPAQ